MQVQLKKNTESLLKNKNFMLLLIGKVVSNIGNSIHSAAVSWFIMVLTGEKSAGRFMAIFGMCSLIPSIICGPISGVFVDRLDRKKIIYGTDIIRGVLILTLAVLVHFNIYPLFSIFTITVLSALVGTFFNPAVDATIPNIVDEGNLTKANSLSGMSVQLTFVLGAAISGFLYEGIGIVGIFIFNGFSFILSGISEMFINIPKAEKKFNKTTSSSIFSGVREDFVEGLRFLKGQKVLLTLMSFALVLNFLFNPIFQIIFPKTIKFDLGMSAKAYGILEGIIITGSIVGMFALTLLPKREKYYKLIAIPLIIQSFLFGLFGVPLIFFGAGTVSSFTAYISFCIIGFIMMICNAMVNVPFFTIFQKRVPDEFRGRFFGMMGTLSQGIVPLGLIVIGGISDVLPNHLIFIAAGAISFALCIWMTLVPEMKEL